MAFETYFCHDRKLNSKEYQILTNSFNKRYHYTALSFLRRDSCRSFLCPLWCSAYNAVICLFLWKLLVCFLTKTPIFIWCLVFIASKWHAWVFVSILSWGFTLVKRPNPFKRSCNERSPRRASLANEYYSGARLWFHPIVFKSSYVYVLKLPLP